MRPASDSLADRFRFLNDACMYLRGLNNRARLCAGAGAGAVAIAIAIAIAIA